MADIQGRRQLERNMQRINRNTETEIEQALTKSALIVERDAKINAPVDTGRLRASITHKVEETYAEVGTNVEYAKSVEFGTSKQSAQPFLFPAYNNNKQKILKELAKAFQKGAGL